MIPAETTFATIVRFILSHSPLILKKILQQLLDGNAVLPICVGLVSPNASCRMSFSALLRLVSGRSCASGPCDRARGSCGRSEHHRLPEGDKEELFEAVGEVVVAQSLDSELVGVHGFDGINVSDILVTANISDCSDMAK